MRAMCRACAPAAAVIFLLMFAPEARAAVATTFVLEGVLQNAGGGPAADGDYALTFALYPSEQGGTALWTETLTAAVKQGRFLVVLGATKPLAAQHFTGTEVWIGLKAGAEPELPRHRMHAVAMALRAAVADGLACTGCVSLSALKIDGDLDLGGYALKVKKLAVTDVAAATVNASTLTASTLTVSTLNASNLAAGKVVATSLEGDGSKLTGIKIPSGACSKAGEVVKGINPDGTLKCVVAMDPTALPADGLDEISNGLLTNQFVDQSAGAAALPIADNNPTGVSDTLDFPDIGIAQSLDVKVKLQNSNIAQVTVWLFDPANTKYVLYDKGGKGTVLDGTWPSANKTISGDLSTWVGKNPKGKWRLQVMDTGFLNNKTDGQIDAWSVQIKTLSTKKVAAKGVFEATAGLRFQTAASDPVTCSAANIGYAYYNTKERNLYICNGKDFDLAVKAPLGSENKPAVNCLSVLTAGDSKGSGVYWIDPDGAAGSVPKFQAWCDMAVAGGGWMLVFNLDTNDGTMRSWFDTAFWLQDNSVGTVSAAMVADFKSGGAYASVAVNEILIRAHDEANDWQGKAAWARYALNATHKGKSMKALLNLPGDTTVATLTEKTGAVAKNAYTRNAGDVFIDHGNPMIVNSTGKAGTDADNRVRIGTDFKNLCTQVDCNGHNVQGGYGGYHDRNNGYPLTYEAMPNFGYHPGPMGFGSNWQNNNGCGNSVWSNKCSPESATLQVDFAIYVR